MLQNMVTMDNVFVPSRFVPKCQNNEIEPCQGQGEVQVIKANAQKLAHSSYCFKIWLPWTTFSYLAGSYQNVKIVKSNLAKGKVMSR